MSARSVPGLPVAAVIALQVRARLAQPLAEALDVADPEVLADEGVRVDASGDDVPARLFRGEATLLGRGSVQHCIRSQRAARHASLSHIA